MIMIVLHSALFEVGFSADEVESLSAAQQSDEVKKALRKNTEDALAAGAFGVPTMIITNTETSEQWMVFGSDRMHIIGQILGQRWNGPLHSLAKATTATITKTPPSKL